ncbi:hypothetical protein D039_4182B, partial [Vibrio parahaemolyticus EKP-028]
PSVASQISGPVVFS